MNAQLTPDENMTSLSALSRRGFMGGMAIMATPSVAAASSLPDPETQEQKCARLLMELLAECRKMDLPIHTEAGRSTDIPIGEGADWARYSYSDDGDTLVAIMNPGRI